MTEQGFDLQTALYELGDRAGYGDGQVTAEQVQAVLARMQGGQGQQPPAPAPDRQPAAPTEPVGLDRMREHMTKVVDRAATMGEEDARTELWGLAETMNDAISAEAQALVSQVELDPRAPRLPQAATDDEGFEALVERVNQASQDPTSADPLALAQDLNATLNQQEGALDLAGRFAERRAQAEREARVRQGAARQRRGRASRLDDAAHDR